MQTKTSKLVAALREGRTRDALKLASSFRLLGAHRDTVHRGWAALQNPGFYRQLGQDPEALVATAVAALEQLYPER